MADPDSWRIYHLYYYLCGSLAMSRRPDQQPNAQGVEKRLGKTGFRKVVRTLFSTDRTWQGNLEKTSKVTTAILSMRFLH